MIENISHEGIILAVVIRHSYSKPGITFCTPDDFYQQLAFMKHPQGKIIQPHVHNIVKREVLYTKEVLVIKTGKVLADFYTEDRQYVSSTTLDAGDVILLASGGHGFTILEDTEMFEIKQGPYAGENDKIRFEPHK